MYNNGPKSAKCVNLTKTYPGQISPWIRRHLNDNYRDSSPKNDISVIIASICSILLLNTKEPNSWRYQLTSIVWKKIIWKSMGTVNCLVTHNLQNISSCVHKKKLVQVLNLRLKNDVRFLIVWWTVPLSTFSIQKWNTAFIYSTNTVIVRFCMQIRILHN